MRGRGEHGVDGVAAGIGKVIAAHAVMLLEMADDGLNGGTPFELALDLRRDAALLAAGVDLTASSPPSGSPPPSSPATVP